MKVKIVDEQDWRTFVDNCECATFFHTCDWYQVWNRYQGYEYRAYLFEFDTGHKALLPLASRRVFRGVFRRYLSSPAGTYGGFLTDDSLTELETVLLSKWVRKFGTVDLTFNPFSPISKFLPITSRDFTQSIFLRDNWIIIEKKMKPAQILRKVKIAERNQLRVRKLKGKEVLEYHKIYRSRRSNWQDPSNDYSESIFENLFQLKGVDFWGVFLKDDLMIGGGPFVKHNNHVTSWLAVALTEYLPLMPYALLYYRLIKFYRSEGLTWFDFNPSGGHEGVVRFKAGFGTIKKPVLNYNYQSKMMKFSYYLNALKNRII